MIAEQKRQELYQALSTAADHLLAREGLNFIVRKAVEVLYMVGKIKAFLGL